MRGGVLLSEVLEKPTGRLFLRSRATNMVLQESPTWISDAVCVGVLSTDNTVFQQEQ